MAFSHLSVFAREVFGALPQIGQMVVHGRCVSRAGDLFIRGSRSILDAFNKSIKIGGWVRDLVEAITKGHPVR